MVAELRQKLAATAAREGEPRPPLSTGLPALDAALQGGLPRGRIVEVSGSGGRMSVALSALASATAQGLLTAFVDPSDALDVSAADARGIDLSRMLWVRIAGPAQFLQATELLLSSGGFGLVVLYLAGVAAAPRMALWPRLVQRAEHAGASLLLLSDAPLAGSYAAATLRMEPGAVGWQRVPGERRRLSGRDLRVEVLRSRLGPPGQDLALPLPR